MTIPVKPETLETIFLATIWRDSDGKDALKKISSDYFCTFKLKRAWEIMQNCVNETGHLDYVWCVAAASGDTAAFDLIVDSMNPIFSDCCAWYLQKEKIDEIKKAQKLRDIAEQIVMMGDRETNYDDFAELIRKSNEPPMAKSTKQHVNDFVTMLTGRMTGDFKGVNTGFELWDDATAGLQPGRLNIIAARPKVGKTALMIQWACYVAALGFRVVYVTAEMTALEIIARILEQTLGIPARVIQTGRLSEMQLTDVISALTRLSTGNFTLVEKIGAEPKQIVAAVNQAHAQSPIQALFIDQLQSLRYDPRRRVFAIGDATKDFRTLGAKLNFPVVLAAQLSREIDRSEGKRPTLAALRDSGEIEQDADTVTFLWKPRPGSTDRELVLAANRFGPTVSFDLKCDFQNCKFTEVSDGD